MNMLNIIMLNIFINNVLTSIIEVADCLETPNDKEFRKIARFVVSGTRFCL